MAKRLMLLWFMSAVACLPGTSETSSYCGDRIVQTDFGESCDDGKVNNFDDCTLDCTIARCGDGIRWAGHEECDDGNELNGDNCDENCTLPRCGNGVTSDDEQCDSGDEPDESCDRGCILARCGNGIVSGAEECDDANAIEGDGCDSNCTRSGCGNGIPAGVEDCDDGPGDRPGESFDDVIPAAAAEKALFGLGDDLDP